MKYLIMTVLMAALLVAGCSSQESTNKQPNLIEKTTQTMNSLSVLKEMTDLAMKSTTSSYKVSYDLDFEEGQKAEVTIYYKNENKTRFDSVGENQSTKSFFVDGKATMCTIEGGKTTCLVATAQEMENPTNIKIDSYYYEEELEQNESEDINFKIYKDGTMAVSGHTANCYKMEAGTSYERYCFSKEGVILYTKTFDNETTTEFIAKSYSTSLSDSDFEIPKDAEIIDMNQELANLQEEYGSQIEEMETLGNCYDDCDQNNIDTELLEQCYSVCLEN